jgi:hypothetical protein
VSAVQLEQALYQRLGAAAPQLLACSAGFTADWQRRAEALILGFGERPAGVACPGAVFAQPFGRRHVAVVQVADQQPDPTGGVPLGFYLVVLSRKDYWRYAGDPFYLSEQLPAPWQLRGELPSLVGPAWPPPRTLAQVQSVLRRLKQSALSEEAEPAAQQTPDEEVWGAALLGGVQVLVDGGRLVFERPGPDTALLRDLWLLLPTRTRRQLWPASFAFSNRLGFDTLVVPCSQQEDLAGYTTEEQAGDYPERRYELALQAAVESGDQKELDALLGRRSIQETWRLGVTLLGLLLLLAVGSRFLPSSRPAPHLLRQQQALLLTSVVGMGDPLQTLTTYLAVRPQLQRLETALEDR